MTTDTTQNRPRQRRTPSSSLLRISGSFRSSGLCGVCLYHTARRSDLEVSSDLRSRSHLGIGGGRLRSGAPDTRHLGILCGAPQPDSARMGIKPCAQEAAIETYMEPVQHGLHLSDARSDTGLGVVQVSAELNQAGLKAKGSRPEINSVSHAVCGLPSAI
jgi:hypothetical protein